MNSPRRQRISLIATMASAAVLAAFSVTSATSAAGAPPDVGSPPDAVAAAPQALKSANGAYIVQLAEPPVVAYRGGVAGLKATKPAKGSKIDPRDPAVIAYVDHLTKKQDALVGKAGGAKLYSYVYSFNGFSAKLSPQAAATARRRQERRRGHPRREAHPRHGDHAGVPRPQRPRRAVGAARRPGEGRQEDSGCG